MTARRIRPRAHAKLVPPRETDVLANAGVGPHGEVVALWTTPDGKEALSARRFGPGGASFPETTLRQPVAVRLTRQDSMSRSVVEVNELMVPHPSIQPLPGGRILVVGRRCAWQTNGPEPNAQVINSNGNVVAAAVLGDGIEHVATTPSGQTWVGYSDEGVYGNLGWGGANGPQPIGASGLARFDENLNRAWDFAPEAGYDPISDCYALNVTNETVWLCYYTGFPIARVAAEHVTSWSNTATGATAIITDGHRVALIGGYDNPRRIIVGELADGRFRVRRKLHLRMPTQGPWEAIGRGETLHLLAGTSHFKLDLDDLDDRHRS